VRNRDPIGTWLRSSRAQRRVGRAAACACGESRPYALIAGRVPPRCFRCERLAHGRRPHELNHPFGQRNSDLTIRYPINDHRAVFSVKQLDWTPEALENPTGDPLLSAIAHLHGLNDNVSHMLAECLTLAPRFKHVQELLIAIYGPDWLPALETAARQAQRKPAKKGARHGE
jgi:hypothetical protein